MDFICSLSKCHSIIIPNMSLVKIRREINKSNFYGTIWSQANEEAVKPFIANLCLGQISFPPLETFHFSENSGLWTWILGHRRVRVTRLLGHQNGH